MAPIFLIGGGWLPESYPETYGLFLKAAVSQARKILIVAAAPDAAADTRLKDHLNVFESLGFPGDEIATRVVTPTSPLTRQNLEEIRPSGLFVCGGLTPLYQEALCRHLGWLDYLAQAQIPYCGFSAGAAIAAKSALVGGWKIAVGDQDFAIMDEDLAEDLEMIDVRPGLGLMDMTVDVHASQWGTISRLLHAVDQRLIDRGWAIDENTMIAVDQGRAVVHGLGQVYAIESLKQGEVRVCIYRAGAELPFP